MLGEVIIDGAIPRTPQERIIRLLDRLKQLAEDTKKPLDPDVLKQWEYDLNAKTEEHWWNEVEDEIVEEIEERLEPCYIVEMGLHCPGDVVINYYPTERHG